MAKPRPEKKRERKNGEERPALPGVDRAAAAPTKTVRVLPMELQIGDRLTDETGEWEIIGRPYTTAGGKTAGVRVQKVGPPDVTDLRTWGAHERIAVRRGECETS